MAAFTKLQEKHPDKKVRFAPLPIGFFFVVFFVMMATWMVCEINVYFLSTGLGQGAGFLASFAVISSFPVFHVMRSYQDCSAKLKAQLEEFSFDASRCYCCTVGHIHPDTGVHLMCDREAVRACVSAWFGSVQAFDAFVHRRLFDKFERGLGRTGVPYRFALMALLPIVWGWMDTISFFLKQNSGDYALFLSLWMLVDFFIYGPLVLAVCCGLAYRVRRRLTFRCVDCVVSLAMGFVWVFVAVVIGVVKRSSIDSGSVANWAVFVVACGIPTCWVYGRRTFCCSKKPNQEKAGDDDRRDVTEFGRRSDQLDEHVEREDTIYI
eukprot:TRINITY_DN13518_c0_g1_i1.p1 TRINITY_DN13518_c0_g1~~TRINITY_DN13518_c0_g1_i1.p1  ORF type:complete len:343 (+),score=28.44 TRINITY_DN13518_c0_g1_i1:65-1030(+)